MTESSQQPQDRSTRAPFLRQIWKLEALPLLRVALTDDLASLSPPYYYTQAPPAGHIPSRIV